MLTPLWLASKELTSHRVAFAIGAAIVAVAVAMTVAADQLAVSRLAAVGTELDHMGPSVVVLPLGTTLEERATLRFGKATFGASVVEKIRSELGPTARVVDARLIRTEEVDGRRTPVIRSDPHNSAGAADGSVDRSAGVSLGPALAEKLGKTVGESVRIAGSVRSVREVRPVMGTAEDAAAFLVGRDSTVNEVRVFLRPGHEASAVASAIAKAHPGLTALPIKRGDDAEHDVVGALDDHRWPLYLLTSIVLAICTMVWSYLNACERRAEMTTLAAIGVPRRGLVLTFVARAAFVGFLGAVGGVAIATAVAMAADASQLDVVLAHWTHLPMVVMGAVAAAVLGSAPVSALYSDGEGYSVLQNRGD